MGQLKMVTSEPTKDDVQDVRQPVMVVNHLEFNLRYLSLNDVIFLRKLLNDTHSDKDLLKQAVFHQLKSPSFSQEGLDDFNDEEFFRIGNHYARYITDKTHTEPFEIKNYSDFRAFIEDRISRWTKLFDNFAQNANLSLQPLFDNATNLSSYFASFAKINESIIQTASSKHIAASLAGTSRMIESLNKGIYSNIAHISATALTNSLRDTSLLAGNLAKVALNFESILNQIIEKQSIKFDFGSILSGLSKNFAQILLEIQKHNDELKRELQESEVVFQESGYAFVYLILDEVFVLEFAKLSPNMRNREVTRKLLRMTQHQEFEDEFREIFTKSKTLKKRWKITQQAIRAHRERNFTLSIPVLLAQAEGIFTEILIIFNLAFRKKRKLYAKTANGAPKLDRNGKLINVDTLNSKVTLAKPSLDTHEVLHFVVELFMERMIKQRNDILHGRICSYDSTKLAVQTLLLVYVLAHEISEMGK